MAQEITIDFMGRIKNFPLPKKHALVPLFEAVVNSIQAIEDRKNEDETTAGRIVIEIVREPVLKHGDEAIAEPHITGFNITDDGIGFNQANFESFLKSDSQYKSSRGGKGVGRFCWLKAFENVHIESSYCENGEWYCRKFDFNLRSYAIDDAVNESESDTYCTCVKLEHVVSDYASYIPSDASQIASSLMYHCLVYLRGIGCPSLVVKDDDNEIDVNHLLDVALADYGETARFVINSSGNAPEEFELLCLKFDYP